MNRSKKREGRESSLQKTVYILWPFLVYFLVHDAAQIALAVLMNASMGMFGEKYKAFMQANVASVNGILNALALLMGMASVLPMALKEFRWAAVVREQEYDEESESCRQRQGMVGKKMISYGLLIVLAVSLAVGMNLLLAYTGWTQSSKSYAEVAARQYGVAFGLGILLYGVVSPLVEEVVFRGLIYNRLKRQFKLLPAMLLCGVVFGLYHGNMVQGVYACALGIVITLMYEWYGSFAAPVLFHGAANISVYIISYDADIYNGFGSPIYCFIFMIISIVSFGAVVWMRRKVSGT